MPTATHPEPKQAHAEESSKPHQASDLQSLLTSGELGARVKGLVMLVSEPRRFDGTGFDGKTPRTSYSRRIEVFCGPQCGTVICGENNNSPDFKPLNVGELINLPILGCKTDGKQMVFRVQV